MCKENMSSKGNGKDKITEAGTSIVCPRDVTDTIVVGGESSNNRARDVGSQGIILQQSRWAMTVAWIRVAAEEVVKKVKTTEMGWRNTVLKWPVNWNLGREEWDFDVCSKIYSQISFYNKETFL